MKLLQAVAWVLVITLFFHASFFALPSYLTERFRKNRASRYVPAALALVCAALLSVKATFFRVGFSSIADMVWATLLAAAAVLLLLLAILLPSGKRR